MKRPAYQWYAKDARSDEVFMLMTYEQQGIYRALLDHQWEEGSIPADLDRIAGLLPKIAPEYFKSVWPLISGKFRPRGADRLVNDRLESQRRELDRFIRLQKAKSRKGVIARMLQLKKRQPAGQPAGLPEKASGLTSSTASSTTTKNIKTSPAEKAPGVREFLGWFQGEYKAQRNGATYFVRWEAHGAIVKRLLTVFPIDRLKKHAQILLTTDEDWTTGTDRGIEILSAKINWLEDRLAAWEVKRKAREAV